MSLNLINVKPSFIQGGKNVTITCCQNVNWPPPISACKIINQPCMSVIGLLSFIWKYSQFSYSLVVSTIMVHVSCLDTWDLCIHVSSLCQTSLFLCILLLTWRIWDRQCNVRAYRGVRGLFYMSMQEVQENRPMQTDQPFCWRLYPLRLPHTTHSMSGSIDWIVKCILQKYYYLAKATAWRDEDLLIIDCKAMEIMYLVASVCPSIRLSVEVPPLFNISFWECVRQLLY